MAKKFVIFFSSLCNAVQAFGPDDELYDGTGGTSSTPCAGSGLIMRAANDGKWYIERGPGTNQWWSIPPHSGSDRFWLVFNGSLIPKKIWFYQGGVRKKKRDSDPNEPPPAGSDCVYEICETVGMTFPPLDADKDYLVTTSCTWIKVLTKWYCL